MEVGLGYIANSHLIVLGLLYGRTQTTLANTMHAQYSKSSMIAEQDLSTIKTVYSFVGEQKAMEKF